MKRYSKEWFENKYGIGWKKEFESWKKKKSEASKGRNTLEGFIKRYGEDEGKKRFESFREKSKHTLESFQKKYGTELGQKKWNDYIHLKKITSKRSIEYWLIQCDGNYEEAKEKLREFQSRNLNWYISQYGKIKGKEKYDKRISNQSKLAKKIKDNFNNGFGYGVSNESQKIFDEIYSFLNNDEKNHTYYSKLNTEFFKNYYYDFVNTKLKIVIEYNGDFWHCNPDLINENYIHPVKNLSAKQIWDFDSKKIKNIENEGYKVLTIWSFDENKIEKIKKFIENVRNN